MRLTDTDELKKTINEVYEYEYPTASGGFDEFVTKVLPNIISNASTIEAEPVRHGHWEKAQPKGCMAYSDVYKQCNLCKEVQYGGDRMKYCPYCGARMDGCGKALGEASDKASDKEEIIVPKKLPSIYKEGDKTGCIDEFARWKIDEVIDCLEQIKERLDGET